ncbi:MAG: PAP/fibrillin family protein [Xenococcaceae cyanobacterium MO_234.B1]|nr:PAP/fibrillin family protein [Xenococcaceae cyanobacterium MO_234.B1]
MSIKAELLEAIAGKNRGLLADEIDNVRVLSAIQQLEDHNPTPKPLEAKELLEGDWRLLYTTSKGILGLDRFPLFKLGQIYQCIRTAEARVYNVAEVSGLPWLEGIVSVAARFEPVSERRINVIFERSIIGLQRLLGYNSPSKFIAELEQGKKFPPLDFSIENREQKGWLDITYLDEDMRVGRGNEGNVFVLAKEKGNI